MLRRNFLKALSSVALMPAARSAPRQKITDIRVVPLKVVRETGKMEPAWNPGTVSTYRIGGGSFIEIRTDQGLIGIGPGMDTDALAASKQQLVGKDPFNIEQRLDPCGTISDRHARSPASKSRSGTWSARARNSRFINCGARRKIVSQRTPA